MAKLIYFTPASVDGYIADETGDFNWSSPSVEVFAFILELLRPMGTYLLGRKNYETMSVWETPEVMPGLTPDMEEFGRVWRAANKVVYSRTWKSVSTPNTRLEHELDPDDVWEMKCLLPANLHISGPTLAAEAIRMELVDEIQLLIGPAMLGGGIPVLPEGVQLPLTLLDERRFDNGMVYVRYKVNW